MINFNTAISDIKAVQPIKKRENNSYLTNLITPQAPQEMQKAKVSPDLAQVVFGVRRNFGANQNGDKASQWVNNLPFAKQLAPVDRRNLANVIRRNDEESDYMKKMIHLVSNDMVTPMATAALCNRGVMSDFAKKDIDTYFDKVEKQGMSVKDAFVPEFATKEEAEKVLPAGDVFRVAGQERIFVKSDDKKSTRLKMDADTYLKLYPPVERFSACQGGNGDCYLLATVNSIMANPYTRATLYGCFEQNGNGVTVKIPKGKSETKFDEVKMPDNTDMTKFSNGPLGMKMIERAYGVETERELYDQYTKTVNKKLAEMKKELAQWSRKNQNDIFVFKMKCNAEKRIENWEKGKAEVDEAMKDPNHTLVILRDDYGELMTGKYGPVTDDIRYVDRDYKCPADYYTGGTGGRMDIAAHDFGFSSKNYRMEISGKCDRDVKKALFSKHPEDYIITASTLLRKLGSNAEYMEETYSISPRHSYTIQPFDNEHGKRMFRVTNPWNQSQTVVMDFEHLSDFFGIVGVAKVHNSFSVQDLIPNTIINKLQSEKTENEAA
ncbi:MAG: hypothetical protein K6C94_02095 [Candidatus Gastranaerophilales bacterium]|nr:hypothetical protein [Candidatus Gastranaerophilales bacterium]